MSNFIEKDWAGTENYHEIAGPIKETEIKHLDPQSLKFSQELYAFVYGRLIESQRSNIEYEIVTTANFLRNVYQIIKVKTHLHHSHTQAKSSDMCMIFVTGESGKIKQNFLA